MSTCHAELVAGSGGPNKANRNIVRQITKFGMIVYCDSYQYLNLIYIEKRYIKYLILGLRFFTCSKFELFFACSEFELMGCR